MRNKVLLFVGLFMISVLMQQVSIVNAQETPSYFAQIDKTQDGCIVTHLFATKMYVPVTIKLFHDAVANFAVVPRSITNSSSSLVTMDANDKNAFLVTTNSTDQFDYKATASYSDGLEHIVYAEYWSQNGLVERDSFQTTKGYFCHHFFLDTSVAPPVPDVNAMIQQAEGGVFGNLIAAVLQDHGSLDNLTIVILVSTGVSGLILIIFLIFNRSSDSATKKMINKIKLAVETLKENTGETKMISQYLILAEKKIADKDIKRNEVLQNTLRSMNGYMRTWQDQFEITFRTMMLEAKILKPNQLEEFEKLKKVVPEQVINIEPISEPVIDVTEIEKEIASIPEPVVETKKPSIKERILHKVKKPEPIARTEEQWKQFFMEKKLTKEQVLKLYNNLTPYVHKNYMTDINSYNKYNALFNLYQELDQQ